MRILFIHEVNYRSKVIFEMHEFPELLALRGHEVSFFHYPEAPAAGAASLRTRRDRIRGRVYSDAEIELVTPPTFGGRVWERYIAPILALPALSHEIRTGGYDVIVLLAVPTTGWQAMALARRAGVPLVFRALDVSHQIRRSVLSRLILRAEKYIYRNATVLSANTPAMAEYCIELSGRTGPSIVNLPPVDLVHFRGAPDLPVRDALGIPHDARVVLYMGSFFPFSGLDVVVRTMAEEFQRYPNLYLVLVGGGELDAELRAIVAELGLEDRVLFTGIIDYSLLPGYLKSADVAINPFHPQLLTNVALPHKVLQYMASKVPAVSTSLRGIRAVLGEDAGVTWVTLPSDVAAAASALAHSSPANLAEIARAQEARVDELFSLETAVTSFELTLNSAIGERR